MIIGIEEDGEGCASRINPIILHNVENEKLSINNFLNDSIKPRISGLDLEFVAVGGGHVLVIRVPKSFYPPHRTNGGGSSRYYVRNSSGVHEADVDELRAIFLQGTMIREKVRHFHAERTALIMENRGIYPIKREGGQIILHIQPMSAFGDHIPLNPVEVRAIESEFRPQVPVGGSTSPRINIDGFAVLGHSKESSIGYCQIFRDGRVEYTRNTIWGELEDGSKMLSNINVERHIVGSACKFLKGLKALSLTPPMLVSASLVDVKGCVLQQSGWHDYEPNYPLEHNILVLPEIFLDFYATDKEYQAALRPMVDGFWNAFGRDCSPNFDSNGNWTPAP